MSFSDNVVGTAVALVALALVDADDDDVFFRLVFDSLPTVDVLDVLDVADVLDVLDVADVPAADVDVLMVDVLVVDVRVLDALDVLDVLDVFVAVDTLELSPSTPVITAPSSGCGRRAKTSTAASASDTAKLTTKSLVLDVEGAGPSTRVGGPRGICSVGS